MHLQLLPAHCAAPCRAEPAACHYHSPCCPRTQEAGYQIVVTHLTQGTVDVQVGRAPACCGCTLGQRHCSGAFMS